MKAFRSRMRSKVAASRDGGLGGKKQGKKKECVGVVYPALPCFVALRVRLESLTYTDRPSGAGTR